MLPELKTLQAVARFGTFAAAGERLGLTQAAVSGQMKRLEEKLGRILFDRTGRSATLNAAGRTVLARGAELLALAERLADPLDPSEQSGRLRIGAIASVHPTVLRLAMPRFHALHPGFHLQVLPGTSRELLDRLDAGELDLALIIRPSFGLPPPFQWETLIRERFVLALPREWGQEGWRQALETRPFLRYHRSSFGGRLVERFLDQSGIAVRDWAELDDIPTLLTMVADGLGVAIVPEALAYGAHFAELRCIPLDDPDFLREIGIVHAAPAPEILTRFIDECRGAV